MSEAVSFLAFPPFLLKTGDNPGGVDKSAFDGMKFAIGQDRLAFLAKFLSDFYNVDVFKGKSILDQVVQWSGMRHRLPLLAERLIA